MRRITFILLILVGFAGAEITLVKRAAPVWVPIRLAWNGAGLVSLDSSDVTLFRQWPSAAALTEEALTSALWRDEGLGTYGFLCSLSTPGIAKFVVRDSVIKIVVATADNTAPFNAFACSTTVGGNIPRDVTRWFIRWTSGRNAGEVYTVATHDTSAGANRDSLVLDEGAESWKGAGWSSVDSIKVGDAASLFRIEVAQVVSVTDSVVGGGLDSAATDRIARRAMGDSLSVLPYAVWTYTGDGGPGRTLDTVRYCAFTDSTRYAYGTGSTLLLGNPAIQDVWMYNGEGGRSLTYQGLMEIADSVWGHAMRVVDTARNARSGGASLNCDSLRRCLYWADAEDWDSAGTIGGVLNRIGSLTGAPYLDMMDSLRDLRESDWLPPIIQGNSVAWLRQVLRADGSPFDLTGANVLFTLFALVGRDTVSLTDTCVIVDSLAGLYEIRLSGGDSGQTDIPAWPRYQAEIRVVRDSLIKTTLLQNGIAGQRWLEVLPCVHCR